MNVPGPGVNAGSGGIGSISGSDGIGTGPTPVTVMPVADVISRFV